MMRRTWLVGVVIAALFLAVGALCATWVQGVVWADEADPTSLPPGQAAEARRWPVSAVRGIVTGVNGDEISVETADDELATLLIAAITRLWVPGEPPTTTVELEVGDPVLAFGEPVATDGHALSARLIVVASDAELPKVLIRGRVVAVTEQTIVVQTGRGERAVTVLPRTRLWSAKGRLASLRDLRPGEAIVAAGQPTSFGQWMAALVFVPGAQPEARRALRGLVTATDSAGTLTVQTERGETIAVITSDETVYRIPGIEEPGFGDIKVGDRITAVGRFEEGSQTRFLAKDIGVIVPASGKENP
jgi:RNase P/RNase MRP subunit p29